MNFEHNLRNGMSVEQLEAIVKESNKREDENRELERLRLAENKRLSRELRISEEKEQAARRNELKEEYLQQVADEEEEKEMLSNASPELIIAVKNIKFLESELAQKEYENKRLTALVSELELKIKTLMKHISR